MSYYVKFSKNGEIHYDYFQKLEDAKVDYEVKKRMDNEGYLDDRFVIGIVDERGSFMRENDE